MDRRLNVINVAEYNFLDRVGGASRLSFELAGRQSKWGYRVFLLCMKLNRAMPTREEYNGITVVRIPVSRYDQPDPRNLLDKIIHTRNHVKKIISEVGNVDVIHSHTPMLGLGSMSAVTRGNTLKIHSIHSPWLEEMRASKAWEGDTGLKSSVKKTAAMATAGFLESRCLRISGFLTSFSDFTRREITREYERAVRDKRFEVFHGWVDTERFSPEGPRTDWKPETGRAPKGPVFFTVRALAPRNGLEMLIDAAAMVRDRGHDFELVIGGIGLLKEKLQLKIEELSLHDQVKLIGRIDEERLPVLYRSCHAFVLPTIALECFGIIILEALASGKPVIATPVGAIPELLSPIYPEGLLPEVSAEALAKALIKHVEAYRRGERDDDKKEKFRRYVCERYSTEIGTGRFRELYESMI
jgi:glycosyltransferase involved in cell wall biosynthesis